MSVAASMFQRRNWDPYRIPLKLAAGLFLLSLLIHFSALLLASRDKLFLDFQNAAPIQIPVNVIFNPPAVDTFQKTAKEEPKDAKFQSSRNLRAEEDTSPESAASNIAQRAGKIEKQQTKSMPRPRVNDRAEKIMSFTQADLIEKGELRNPVRTGDGAPIDSAGFFEKLRKGAELKISAKESDYGQYITRMKRKIAQQWSPQRTISAGMYSYNQVQMDLAVILNDQGEIADLVVTGRSGFADFDSETIRAVREAAPFPNPPKSLIQPDDHRVYMPWSFTVFMNNVGAYRVE